MSHRLTLVRMTRLALLSTLLLAFHAPGARAQHPAVQAAIDAVNIDSLILDLRQLDGEAPIDLGNGPQSIVSRNKNQPGNPLAADWLQLRMQQLGFEPTLQVFSGGTGENIIAEKPGALHPERKVIICGHYDAMPGGPVAAPAADDDGSGTVAVLEAMRVLRDITCNEVPALFSKDMYLYATCSLLGAWLYILTTQVGGMSALA